MFTIGIGAHRIRRGRPSRRERARRTRAAGTTATTNTTPHSRPTNPCAVTRRRRRSGLISAVADEGGRPRQVPGAVRGRRLTVDVQPVPPLEREQGPDQQAVVHLPLEMLLQHPADVFLLEVPARESPWVEEDLLDV